MEVEEISKVESQGELYGGHKFHEWLSKLLHLNHLEGSFQKWRKFLAIDQWPFLTLVFSALRFARQSD